MCGLVGMMGTGINVDDLKFIKDLAYVNGLRGRDGSGIMQGVGNKWKQDYKVCKTWHEISYLLWFNEWSSKGDRTFLNNYKDNFFAVHSRWATVGANSDSNSHPFEFSNLVGMHNGTLEDAKYWSQNQTDSELMFEEMNQRGIIPVLKDLDKKSAYAIVVFDRNTGELVFARNEKRPLWFAYNKERAVAYWASEYEMLELCAARNHMKLSDVVYLRPGHVYRVYPYAVPVGGFPKWESTELFPKGATDTTTLSSPKANDNDAGKDKKKFNFGNSQEAVEIERATKAGNDLVTAAKAARHNRHVPRILDGSVDSSRLWEDCYEGTDIFDQSPWEPDELKAEPKDKNDRRFNPKKIPACKCDFCGDKLNLLQKWYATSWPDGVVACSTCYTLSKETEAEVGVQTH